MGGTSAGLDDFRMHAELFGIAEVIDVPRTSQPQQPFERYAQSAIDVNGLGPTRQAAVASSASGSLAVSRTETAVARDIEGKSSRKSSSVDDPSR